MKSKKELIELIFIKRRFNRHKFLTYVNSKLEGKCKSVKLGLINDWELKISEGLTEHIESCSVSEECDIEKVFEKALKVLDLKKEEILFKKSFWENIITNPIGIGILLIGFTNLIVAIINIFRT